MANIIVKSDEQRKKEEKTLQNYGVNPNGATVQQREFAESIYNRMDEFEQKMKKRR